MFRTRAACYAPSERETFFDHLTKRGVSWKLYEHGYGFLRLYRNFTFDLTNIVGFEEEFETAALSGTLPSVSFIEPDYIELPNGNDDHAPADMMAGQKLIAKIVRALVRGKKWNKTLLIITYDEHGGFYDHVMPPEEIEVRTNGTVTTQRIPILFNSESRLGVRVPAFVASPLVPRGPSGVNLCSDVFEHASIPATILRRFCSPHPPRLSGRTVAANDLGRLLTLNEARPGTDFTELLARLDLIADATTNTAPPVGGVPSRKKTTGEASNLEEDFTGFIAMASAITGRGRA